MTQYIDTSLINDNEFWDASSWRKMCRELAGLRGLAPAVHFHNNVNDNNSSQLADDDRIFRVHTHVRLYVWGMEMYAGAYDTLKIYWRSTPPDANWTLDGGWTLIKGAGAFYSDSWTYDGANPKGTPESALGSTSTGLAFPATNPLPDGSTQSTGYFYNQWLVEVLHSGNIYTMAGPNVANTGGKGYHTKTSNFLRSFLLIREGYWKFVLDETSSPYYNASLDFPGTGGEDYDIPNSDWYRDFGLMSPVSYSSNPNLYGSLPGHIDADKSLHFNKTGVRYRSQFTRVLNVQSFFPDKDLVTGNNFSRTYKTMTPGVSTNDYVVNAPYTRVTGYGAEWGGTLQADTSSQYKMFIKTKNSSGQDGTTGFPYTEEIGPNERFGNVKFRYTPLFKKKTINRRHLYFDGVTVNGNQTLARLWETEPIYVVQDEPATGLGGDSSLAKGWLIDFRGSIFKNCTFKNVVIASEARTCWSGCSFVNCKFINCAVNPIGDSILFQECAFQGCSPNGYDTMNCESLTSSAIVSSQFLNIDRFFIATARAGPVSDNLIWRNIFDGIVNQSAGSEIFTSEFPAFMRTNAQLYSFTPQPIAFTEYIGQQHEFSRNMFIFNTIFNSNGGLMSPYATFSRANFYYGNCIYDGVRIAPYTIESTQDKCLYESWAHNFIHKIQINFDNRTYHARFLLNTICRPQDAYEKGSNNQYASGAGGEYPFIATQDRDATIWYCGQSHGMANKVLKNIILNWGDFFMKHWWGPCSTFLNFHHVYDPDFDINSSSDVYWGNNNKWKYVNVAHRNYFFFPWPLRRYAWSDGDIGRKNADGSSYAVEALRTTLQTMPIEYATWDYDETRSPQYIQRPYKCSQDPVDIGKRNLCRAIYVKNSSSGVYEMKNDGSVFWISQMFRPAGSLP